MIQYCIYYSKLPNVHIQNFSTLNKRFFPQFFRREDGTKKIVGGEREMEEMMKRGALKNRTFIVSNVASRP